MHLVYSRAAKRGGFKRGGFPIWTCPSFFVLNSLNGGLANGGLMYLSTIVPGCRDFATKIPLRRGPKKATKVHNCGRLCANCREWPWAPIWEPPFRLSQSLSFFVLFGDFPDFFVIFPICPGTLRGFSRLVLFLLLCLLTAPTRNSPERVRDTIWTFPRGPQDWKNSISRGDIEKIKLSIQNEIFNREWNFHSRPLSGRRKTGPGIEIFNREWNFQTENEHFKREWKFRARGSGFFMRSSENEFFRYPGPLDLSRKKWETPGFGNPPV